MEFLSADLSAQYFVYQRVNSVCQAVGGGALNYYSGETLLSDYSTLCFGIDITNGGTSANTFILFLKQAITTSASLMLAAAVAGLMIIL